MKKYLVQYGTPLLVTAIVAAPVATMIAATSRPSRVEVYNYVDYISEASRARILENYGYKEFGDLPEFRSAVENRQTPFGVGSDYYNVQLANDGLIQPLEYNVILDGVTTVFNNNTPATAADDVTYEFSSAAPLAGAMLRNAVQSLYTPQTWDLLNAYNNTLSNYAAGRELWEYMVPYLIQQKVVAINPFKVAPLPGQAAKLAILKGYDQDAIDQLFNNRSYADILQVLSNIGFTTLAVNNYMRDNLGIGSEGASGNNPFSMDITTTNYPQLVASFREVMEVFRGKRYSVDSGYETLAAVHPTGNSDNISADVAILYNGDALDAYLGSDQVIGVDEPQYNANVRIIWPRNSSYLLDGLVIPTYVTGGHIEKANRVIKYAFLENLTNIEQATSETDTSPKAKAFDGSITDFNIAYANFDLVNYTSPYLNIYNDVLDSYFSDLEPNADNLNQNMTGTGAYATEIFTLKGKIDYQHLTTPISANLETAAQSAYNAMLREVFES